jgi:hypothetical protein
MRWLMMVVMVVVALLSPGVVWAQTPTPTPTVVVALKTANLRTGPGTTFKVGGSAKAGDRLVVVGKNAKGDWLELDSGLWIAAFLVSSSSSSTANTGGTGSAKATATPKAAVPAAAAAAPAPATSVVKVVLRVVENSGQYERLAIVNQGSGEVAIGGWVVYGSKGDERCVVPGGVVLAAGAQYEIASGNSSPQGAGMVCANKPIWNNKGERITLEGGGISMFLDT